MFKQKQKKINFWMLVFFVGVFFFALGQGEAKAGVNRVQTKTLTPDPSHPYIGTYDDYRGGIADQTIKQAIDKICALAGKGVATTTLSYKCATSGNQQSRHNGSWMPLNQPVPSGGAWCEDNGVEWVDCDDTPICFSTPQSISTSTLTPDPVDPHIGTYDDFRMGAGQTPAQAVAGVCALAGKDGAASPLEYNCATSGNQQSRHNGTWMTVAQSNLIGGQGDCQGYGIDKVSCVDVVPTGTYYTCLNGGTLSGTTCTYGASTTGGVNYDTAIGMNPGDLYLRVGGLVTKGYISPSSFTSSVILGMNPGDLYVGVGGLVTKGYTAPSAGTYGGTYTCPFGGTLSGATCTYPATQVAACTPPSSTLIKNAQFISYADVPATATTGQVFTASITMKNTGDATWLQGDYRLSSIGNSWGTTSVALTRNVAKGETYTFTQAFIAPDVVGTYNFQWQMLVGVTSTTTLFGDATTNQQITVNATPTSAVNGACGTANNTTTYPAPSAPSALCSVGPASIVSTPDVWNWTCAGFFGGSSASCMAKCDPAYQSYDCISVPAASCDQSNAGKTIVTTTARCIGVDPVNSCTSPDFPTLQDCADALVTCPADTTTTCPAPLKIDSWKEVAP